MRNGIIAAQTEVKPVSMTTGFVHRIYLMCAAYYGSTCTCFGMLPYGFILFFIAFFVLLICIFMIIKKSKFEQILYYVFLIGLVNLYSVVIYFVIGGDALGIKCRVVWPVFMSFSMTILIAVDLFKNENDIRKPYYTMACVGIAFFLLVDIYSTQTVATDFFIANKLDAQEMNQIEAEIERYETNTGTEIKFIAVRYADDAVAHDYSNLLIKKYETWTYHRKVTHNSWSTVELLNYITGSTYIKTDMSDSIYNKYFARKNWTTFIPEEQLIFAGNTLYWAIY